MYAVHVGVRQTNQNIPEIFCGTGSKRRDVIHESSRQQHYLV